MEVDLPVLAICRGAQVLNIAAGGTLIQDIPSGVSTTLSHQITLPRDAVAHDIQITAGSRLEQALGAAVAASRTCRVNSRHHQSVARLGEGLVSSATAGDGVIEAVEKPDASFCVGVQWHPENFWRTGEFSPLFRAFVEAARKVQEVR
jgi:putative glutamine amidotransferase